MALRDGIAVLAIASVGVMSILAGCSSPNGENARLQPTSRQEAGQALARCLEDRGWVATAEADGGVVSEYPPEQEDRYTTDLDACLDIVGPAEPIQYTREQYEDLYASALEAQRCLLEEFGYETPKAPSLGAFIEMEGAWSPFPLLPSEISAEEFTEIQETCPQPRV